MSGPSAIAAPGSISGTAPARTTTNESGPQNAAWNIALVQAGAAPPAASINAAAAPAQPNPHQRARLGAAFAHHLNPSHALHLPGEQITIHKPHITGNGTAGTADHAMISSHHQQPSSVVAPASLALPENTHPATISPPDPPPPARKILVSGDDPTAPYQGYGITQNAPARLPPHVPIPKAPLPPTPSRPAPQEALVSAPVPARPPANPAANPHQSSMAAPPAQDRATSASMSRIRATSIVDAAAPSINKTGAKPLNLTAAAEPVPPTFPHAPTLAVALSPGHPLNARATPVAVAAPIAPTSPPVPATPSGLAAAVTAMHRNGESSAVLRLDPPGLGTLSVHVGLGQDASINVMFVPATVQTAQLLHAGMDALRQAMTTAGLTLGQTGIDGGQRDSRQQAQQQPSPAPQPAAPNEPPPASAHGVRATA